MLCSAGHGFVFKFFHFSENCRLLYLIKLDNTVCNHQWGRGTTTGDGAMCVRNFPSLWQRVKELQQDHVCGYWYVLGCSNFYVIRMAKPSEASLNILFNGFPIYLHPFTCTAKKPYLKHWHLPLKSNCKDWWPRGTVFVYSVVKFKKKRYRSLKVSTVSSEVKVSLQFYFFLFLFPFFMKHMSFYRVSAPVLQLLI